MEPFFDANLHYSDYSDMYALWLAQWCFPVLVAADELQLIEGLENHSSNIGLLAQHLDCNLKGLTVLCDVLVNLGFLRKSDGETYRPTPKGLAFFGV